MVNLQLPKLHPKNMKIKVPFILLFFAVNYTTKLKVTHAFINTSLSPFSPFAKQIFRHGKQVHQIQIHSIDRIRSRITTAKAAPLYSSSESSNYQKQKRNNNNENKRALRKTKKTPKRFREKAKNNPQHIKAKSIAKGRDPLISLNMNLDYMAKTGAAKRAEEMLLRIEQLFEEGYYATSPDTVSYNSVMYAYAFNESDEYDSTEEVLRIFDRMQELSEKGKNVRPNVITLNILIRCFAKKGDADGARKILDDMEHAYRSGSKHMSANTRTFNTVIHAYAKAKRPEEAEEVLKQMMLISREEPERGEDIKADTISFNSVLHAWQASKRNGAAPRAQQLLDHMIKLHSAGNHEVKPDRYSYTATISAWSCEYRHPDALDKTMELLHKMENYCALGNEDMCPNIIAYTAAINTFARSEVTGTSDKAYEILLMMEQQFREGNEDMKPDFICYSSVIDALAKSDDENSGHKAVELLNHMITLAEMGHEDIEPNSQVYLSVISALGRSKARGSADTAQKLLNEMERSFALGNKLVSPNTYHFNAVIHAWALSSFVFKADRAYKLLKRMEEESSKGNAKYSPDIITYNSVILAAANSFGDSEVKSKAFRIALTAFKAIQASSDVQQTTRTYAIFLKAIRKLYKPGSERDTITKKILQFCCRDGLLNQFVLHQAELTCSSTKVLREIFSQIGHASVIDMDGSAVELKTLPWEWKANISQSK